MNFRAFRLLALPGVLILAACGVSEGRALDAESDEATFELRALQTGELLGDLTPGTPVSTLHPGSPRYRAWRFTAPSQSVADVWVRSTDGDATAWVLGANFATLASDTAVNGTDSHLVKRLTAGGTYYVAFREAKGRSATFTVTLSLGGASDAGVTVDAGVTRDAGVPTSSSGGFSNGGWEWQNPLPQGAMLADAWGSSASDVWVVGGGGAMLHFDGTTWSPVASGTTQHLRSVWGSSANDVWAVGDLGTIRHWDGATWSTWTGAGNRNLAGVSGTGPNDVWVVGNSSPLHWDGVSWKEPSSAYLSCFRSAVWAVAPNDVWASSVDGTCHWNGVAWVEVPLPSLSLGGHTNYRNAITVGGAANEVWALVVTQEHFWGPYIGAPAVVSNKARVLHWTGFAWAETFTFPLTQESSVCSIKGRGANDVWVACGREVAHFNGSGWTTSTVVKPASAVWPVGPRDAWVFGDSGFSARGDGSTWVESSAGSTVSLLGVTGTSTSDKWVVGEQGTALHWDGTRWSSVATGTSSRLAAVWAASATDVWAVGDSRTVLRWNGVAWAAATAPDVDTYSRFRCVFGSGSQDVWVGGDDFMHHWDGTAWVAVRGVVDCVHGSSAGSRDAWVVTDGHGVFHWDGFGWAHVAGMPDSTSAVWSGGGEGWAFNYAGAFKLSGTSWGGTPYPFAQKQVNAFWGSGPRDLWAVGSDGLVGHFDGTSWASVDLHADPQLQAVWGVGSEVTVVGWGGAILVHR